ncbi:MAG: hypothetical protein ACE37K_06215 [Planctomycetota bacterium]
MALDIAAMQSTLEAALKTNFEKAVEEEWDRDRSAQELAAAIATAVDAYVRAAVVSGVRTEVLDVPGTTVIGSGTQAGSVSLS